MFVTVVIATRILDTRFEDLSKRLFPIRGFGFDGRMARRYKQVG